MSEGAGVKEGGVPTVAWMRWVLFAAGVYNLAWGAVVVVFPLGLFRIAGLQPPLYPSIWQCVGMIVGVYGVGYLAASRDPTRHWPIVLVGLLGKVLGPIGFVWAAQRGELPWSFGWTIVTNDLVWWWPFAAILWAAARSAGAPSTPEVSLEHALEAARDQHGVGLREHSEARPVLVLFIRHAGCTFCKQALADLAAARADVEARGMGLAVAHMSDEAHAAALLGRYGLADLPRFADPQRDLYRAMGLQRGSLGQLFGPRVWARGIAATLGGHLAGKLDGDGFQLGGVFVVHRGRVVAAHRNTDAADRPDPSAVACEVTL